MSYKRIRELDPLFLDATMRELPAINADRNTVELSRVARNLTLFAPDIATYDKDTSMAALRDIDFIIASGVRHGVDLVDENPQLETMLLQLGRTANSVPRGSVATYALSNPTGERERSFTGSDTEALFIQSVRESSEAVEAALATIAHTGIADGLQKIDDSLTAMVEAIITVKREVTPSYFTHELRPYFDPVEIGGVEYAGAGGAQLQMIAIDYILWGMNSTDETYVNYFNDNYRYLSPAQKDMLEDCRIQLDGKTIIESVEEHTDEFDVEIVYQILKKLKKFRFPHRKLAEDNFKIRDEGSVGSGTYAADILTVLIERTEESIARVEKVRNE